MSTDILDFAPFLVLVLLTLAPLLWVLRGPPVLRGRRGPALALHRAQLTELDQELAQGRITSAEHGAAKLEVQRRLLASADLVDVEPSPRGRALLLAMIITIPLAAETLYLIGGRPDLPDATAQMRRDMAAQKDAEDEGLITKLRQTLMLMPRGDKQAQEGWVLLGNIEAGRGRLAEAAKAWMVALDLGFNADLAAQTAEAQYQSEGRVSDETRALFRRALEAGPATASWRELATQRVNGP